MLSLLLTSLLASTSLPSVHGADTWIVNEVFSDSTGTIQFVELLETGGSPDAVDLAGKSLASSSTGMSFTFPADLPPGSSANRTILLGTSGFESAAGTPAVDHVLPDGFFDASGDTLQWHVHPGSSLSFGPGDLPTDGVCALTHQGEVALNTPKNFAGSSGRVDLTPHATATPYEGTTPGSIVSHPDRLATTPVVLGSDWVATVTPQPLRMGGTMLDMALFLVTDSGPPGVSLVFDLSPVLLGFGSAPPSQLLVTGNIFVECMIYLPGSAAPGSCTLPVPENCSLLGREWFAQAIAFGNLVGDGTQFSAPMFTNGVRGVAGSR